MEKILKSHQISTKILDLVTEKESGPIVLVTPYYDPWKRLEEALKEASDRGEIIILILRSDQKSKLKYKVKKLNEELGIDIIFVDRLHSKIYMNYNQVIIGSMNLYDSSQSNNYEFAYIINSIKENEYIYNEIIKKEYINNEKWEKIEGRYFKERKEKENKGSVISRLGNMVKHKIANVVRDELDATKSEKQEIKKIEDQNESVSKNNTVPLLEPNSKEFGKRGFCIRCRKRIKYSIARPMCRECFETWSIWSNYDYEEKFCALCGREESTRIGKPMCEECFRSFPWARNVDVRGF